MRITAASFVVAGLALAFPFAAQDNPLTFSKLFIVQRSVNANEVHYDARVQKDGTLDPRQPVESYWIKKAGDGSRGPLSFLQRFAYGHSARRAKDGRWTLTLTAYKERHMELVKLNGHWRAQGTIAGKLANVNTLYVKVEGGGLIPNVLWIDVFGEDVETGAAVKERVVRK